MSIEPHDASITSGADMAGRSDADESEKHISMPDIYADDNLASEPNLTIVQQPSADGEDSPGFNPYDTGVLLKK